MAAQELETARQETASALAEVQRLKGMVDDAPSRGHQQATARERLIMNQLAEESEANAA